MAAATTSAERIAAALETARRRTGNPYGRLAPIEALTDADWSAMTDGQREQILDGVARLVAREHERGLECHTRALALRDRFAEGHRCEPASVMPGPRVGMS